MRLTILSMLLGALLCAAAGCKDKPTPPKPSSSAARPEIGPSASATAKPKDPDIGRATAMLRLFLQPNADHQKLAVELIPKDDDYAAVFVDSAVAEAKQAYGPRFERGQLSVAPSKGDSEVSVVKVTTEQLRKREGNSLRFPGGYLRIAHRLRPGVSWYTFSFGPAKKGAGNKPGLTYDGLVFVNGHWAMFPSPGRVLSPEATGDDGPAADVAGDDGSTPHR